MNILKNRQKLYLLIIVVLLQNSILVSQNKIEIDENYVIEFMANNTEINITTHSDKYIKSANSEFEKLYKIDTTTKILSINCLILNKLDLELPYFANLSIINKNGTINIDSIKGSTQFKLNNCHLKVKKLKGYQNKLELINCKQGIDLKHCSRLEIKSENSKLQIANSKFIWLLSKNSNIEIEYCDNMLINSTNDTLEIKEIYSLVGKTYDTKAIVDKLTGHLSTEHNGGIASINNIVNNLGSFSLSLHNANSKVYFSKEMCANIFLLDSKSKISYPEEFDFKRTNDESEEKKVYLGAIGENCKKAKIKIDSYNSNLNINLK